MMPERRPLGELATQQDQMAGYFDAILQPLEADMCREAAARLREFEGTVIEGWAWPDHVFKFTTGGSDRLTVFMGRINKPCTPITLILKESPGA